MLSKTNSIKPEQSNEENCHAKNTRCKIYKYVPMQMPHRLGRPE